MAAQTSPTFRRRRLARRLRQLRESAGFTLAEAAPKLDKRRSTLSRIENGDTLADVHLVRSMMDLYDHYDETLLELAREAAQRGWWYHYGIKDRGYIGMETEASRVLELSLLYIPGLLQTEAYTRAVLGTSLLRRAAKQFENDVAARLYRQRRLVDDEVPLELAAIVDESALRKPVGGAAVMRAQLRHLAVRAELDAVTLQVMPNAAGAHIGMDGAFTILTFAEDEDPDMLYVSHPTGAAHSEKPAEVRQAKLVFDRLRSDALSPADSVALIERVAGEL